MTAEFSANNFGEKVRTFLPPLSHSPFPPFQAVAESKIAAEAARARQTSSVTSNPSAPPADPDPGSLGALEERSLGGGAGGDGSEEEGW
jgi:hypothetical protein